MTGLAGLAEHVENFHRRVVQDALSEATSAYWERRAEAFEAARPTPNEFHGNETREELRGRWLRLTEVATACRNRASVSLLQGDDIAAELADVLAEVA